MKRALLPDCFIAETVVATSGLHLWLKINWLAEPIVCCPSSKRLTTMCRGSVVSRGRIRACSASNNSNSGADSDHRANAQACDGCTGSTSCTSSRGRSSRSRSCWNWSGGLSHCLRRSESQDCRSDQNFFHERSFWFNRGKTL